MKFIDSEMMERYLRGESGAEESHKVLMWLMINLRSSSADSEFKELLEKVPVSENAVRKQRVKSRLGSLMEEDRRYVMKERRRKVVKVLYGHWQQMVRRCIIWRIPENSVKFIMYNTNNSGTPFAITELRLV